MVPGLMLRDLPVVELRRRAWLSDAAQARRVADAAPPSRPAPLAAWRRVETTLALLPRRARALVVERAERLPV